MIYAVVAVVAVLLLVSIGWKLTSRNAYESAEYTVIESHGEIELRGYPDLMLATTETGTRAQDDDGSFGRLFRYISGGNQGKQKVAMTTPVFMVPKTELSSGRMAFVIPKEVAASSIPEPTGEHVHLTKRLGGEFAVIRFAGRFDRENQAPWLSKLEDWVEQNGFDAVGEPEVASYDPPWTPGPLRRNEILIRVTKIAR